MAQLMAIPNAARRERLQSETGQASKAVSM